MQIIREEGIEQVEEFGIHLNEDGTLVYGMQACLPSPPLLCVRV